MIFFERQTKLKTTHPKETEGNCHDCAKWSKIQLEVNVHQCHDSGQETNMISCICFCRSQYHDLFCQYFTHEFPAKNRTPISPLFYFFLL